jgi:hypothetical protein
MNEKRGADEAKVAKETREAGGGGGFEGGVIRERVAGLVS